MLRLHLDLILPERAFKNVKIFGMEDLDIVLFSDYQDLTFFHLLTEDDPLIQFKGVTFDPLTLGMKASIIIFFNLPQRYKVKFIIERIVQD